MVEPVSSDLLAPPTEAGSIPSPRWQAPVGAAGALGAAGRALGAVQIPGGAGIVQGSRAEWLFRMLRMYRVLTGTSEIQRNTIARELLGDTR